MILEHEPRKEMIPMPKTTKPIQCCQDISRTCLFISGAFSTFIFAGAFYGWGPLQLMLEKAGSFRSKCDVEHTDNNDGTCSAQISELLLVRFTSQLTIVASPLLGYLSDQKGDYVLSMLMTVLLWIGLSLLVVSVHFGIDFLLYISLPLIGLASWSGGILTVQTGLMFQGKIRTRVISALNALFDAGASTYLCLWLITEYSAATSLTEIFVGYLLLSIICLGPYTYFWTVVKPEQECSNTNSKVKNTHSMAECIDVIQENTEDTVITHRSNRQQMLSQPFILLCLFFAFHLTSNVWTLTTSRDFLKYIGDDDNAYLAIFTVLGPLSLVALPFQDIIIQKFGFHAALQAVNVLSIAHSIIKVSSTDLNVQIIGFVLFSFFRCFLFSVTFSFLPKIIDSHLVGEGVGIFYMVGGIVSLLNIVLARVAIEVFDGDFFIPNLVFLLLNIPCVYIVWRVKKCIKQDERAKPQIA